ncbi:MAG: 2-hydroxyacid dehydrogenase [Micromonosporaceae bacterium]
MADERLVAVSYTLGDALQEINQEVLGDQARLVFLPRLGSDDERVTALRQAEVLIGLDLAGELPEGAFREAKALTFVQLLSAGADHVNFGAIPDRVVIAGNVGAYAKPMAEHVMAMTLALAKRLPQGHAALARGEFEQAPTLTLDGAVCAILGFGGIGSATARLMRAFGARIHAVNSSGRTAEPVEFAGTLADLDQVLAAADVLVISLPLTSATRGLIGRRELGQMKPGAILINVARGAIVDEQALYEHLLANPRFGAGIDTWWREPLHGGEFATRYPFFDLPNLLGSPHNSGIVSGILGAAARQAAGNVRAYMTGALVRGVVRREDYSA